MGIIVKIISFTIFIAAFLFCAVGYGAPWWWVDNISGVASMGLFQSCVEIKNEWECELTGKQFWDDHHKATIAMMTIGLFINLVTFGLYGMSFCGEKSIKSAAGASLGGGIFQLIGVILFGSQYEVETLGWAFWVATVGGVGHIGNSIVTMILDCISCC